MTAAQDDINQKEIKKKNFFHSALVFIREVLALLIWGYVVINSFIFSIDIFLVECLSPSYGWLIQYKFFILIGVLVIILLVTKNKHIILWSLFILFYPIILIFWRMPVLIYRRKSWNLSFAMVDSIVSFFKSFKHTFITISLFLISMVIILAASDRILLWISLTILLAVHLWIYIQKMISVFKPSSVYQVYSKIFQFSLDLVKFERIPSASSLTLSDEELELPVESMDEKQLQKWTTGVQWLALFNRVCLFVAKKTKAYQNSRFNIISSVFGILLLVLYTIFSFTLLNFALFKIDPNYFSFSVKPTFFNFIYYSYNNFLFNSIQEIVAKAPIAQIAAMAESFFALFLIVILVSLVFSFRSQRETEELDTFIAFLKDEGTKAEEYLKDKYKLNTVEDAMQALQKINALLADMMYSITKTINN